MKRTVRTSILCGLILVLIPALAHAQRGGRGGGARASGSRIGTMNPPARRPSVVAAADGRYRDGTRPDRGRPGYGYQGNHPVAAGAAVARRRGPMGRVTPPLPMDCSMTFISEMEYYYCSGQYYQPMGTKTDPMYVAA